MQAIISTTYLLPFTNIAKESMDVEGSSSEVPEALFFLNKKLKDRNVPVKVNAEHKEFYSELSKLGKLVEKVSFSTKNNICSFFRKILTTF